MTDKQNLLIHYLVLLKQRRVVILQILAELPGSEFSALVMWFVPFLICELILLTI